MSLQHVELELDVNNSAIRGQALLSGGAIPKANRQTATQTLNARLVEFIAKPGKGQLLEDCVRGEITDFLSRQNGFSGAIILNSHQERRLILVVSFWTTQRIAAENCWERSRVVRQTAGSFIDACSRVHTYVAAFAKLSGVKFESSDAWEMMPEVRE
jgi:heme-degrading monooxygenase HmoA